MFAHGNIRKTFTVMHNPVFDDSDTLSFVCLACIILLINGKQFKCSVSTFVQYSLESGNRCLDVIFWECDNSYMLRLS